MRVSAKAAPIGILCLRQEGLADVGIAWVAESGVESVWVSKVRIIVKTRLLGTLVSRVR